MKLDPTVMRTMSGNDFRVLEAVEKGMNTHSLVPAPLISSISNLRHGGTGKILSGLLRDKLLSHDKSCGYDGYRLTNAGYDIMALHTLKTRKCIAAIGDRVGTGKESDIYLGVHPNGQQVILKIHRLGRTSFRNVKKTRDYFVYHPKGKSGNAAPASNQANSWLFLSRKSALKEYAFMQALYKVDYPTPEPIAHSRHIVVMSLVRGVPLYQVQSRDMSSEQASSIFHQAADLAVRLAKHGLVHCDLNEFNLLIDLSGIQHTALSQEHDPYVRHSGTSVAAESTPGRMSARGPWEPEHLQPEPLEDVGSQEEPAKPAEFLDNGEPKPIVTLIDFPQMVSTQHPNADELYERDTACLFKFFAHKLQFQIPEEEQQKLHLTWASIQEMLEDQKKNQLTISEEEAAGDDTESVCLANKTQLRLDQDLKASGYSEQDAQRNSELYYYNNEESNAAAPKEDLDDEKDGGEDEHDELGDNDSIESLEEEETASVTPSTTMILPVGQLAELNRAQLQEQARLRVQQQLEAQKKKGRQRGAFRKSNSNKTYVKGKRVFQDIGLA
jgi:RIO kinase 2